MGTERQGIHKDMDMKRIDEEGNVIADYEWGEEKLIYEEIKEEGAAEEGAEAPPEKCTVTLFEHPDFTGWEAAFTPGEYDHAALADGGAANDDCESVVVSPGCYAVLAENGEHDGWELVLSPEGGDGTGRYDGPALDALGNHPDGKHSVLNGVSSMVVHEGTAEEAKEVAAKAKKGRAEGLPQRGQIDLLDEGSFDQYMSDRPDKMIVVDFYAPWCHWCQLLDPVWKQTAEQLPDQEFAVGVRMAKVRSPIAPFRRCCSVGLRVGSCLSGGLRGEPPAVHGAHDPCLPDDPDLHPRREHPGRDLLRRPHDGRVQHLDGPRV